MISLEISMKTFINRKFRQIQQTYWMYFTPLNLPKLSEDQNPKLDSHIKTGDIRCH